ncbi:serine/threonine protein kinase [Candidatus Woesearchaeota archaeon]|nr:serine/threonine protein kinase [Candidatus Woesearchaeota archaeon]
MVSLEDFQRGLRQKKQEEQEKLSAALEKEGFGLVSELGEGGEGTTYLIEREGQRHAGKFLPVAEANNAEDLEKVLHEAEVLRHLAHSRIPQYHGIVELPELGGFLTIREFIDNDGGRTSLRDILRKKRALPEKQAANILDSVLEIMEYLHDPAQHPAFRVPVVHRDIKPDHIFVDAENRAYLIDFGIAKTSRATQATRITKKGTFEYMPPEQNVGDGYPQSDLFSLGVTALEMLLGEVPEYFRKGYFSRNGYALPSTVGLNPSWKEILETMVKLEYAERPASAGKIRKMLREKGLLENELEEKVKSVKDEITNDAFVARVQKLAKERVDDASLEIASITAYNRLLGLFDSENYGKIYNQLNTVKTGTKNKFLDAFAQEGYRSHILFNLNSGNFILSYFTRHIPGTEREQILIETEAKNKWFRNKPFTGYTYAETKEGECAREVVSKIMGNGYGKAIALLPMIIADIGGAAAYLVGDSHFSGFSLNSTVFVEKNFLS